MNKHFSPMKCYFCGRFMRSDSPLVVWTPFGGPADLEPPDEEFAHQSCWEKQSDGGNLVKRTSWMGPMLCQSYNETGVLI